MTQLQIIQQHDLNRDGYMSHYEAAQCGIAHRINVEQIWSAYTPDDVLTELYKRVDLRHPTLVGFHYGDNWDVGHMVVSVGYLLKNSDRRIRGFYFMDPDWPYSGYRYIENFLLKDLLSPPYGGFYALTAFTGTAYNKPVANDESSGMVEVLVVSGETDTEESNESGSFVFLAPPTGGGDEGGDPPHPPYPDDPLEKTAADATLEARADGIVGPGGDFGYLYSQYYSTVRFADAGEVVMKSASPEGPCNRTANYTFPVVDGSGQFRGMVSMRQVFKCDLPPGPVEMQEYLVKFPDEVVAEKVATGESAPVEPLLTYKVKEQNPGYTVQSVWGPNRLGYPTTLFPFVEITDSTTGETHTYAPRREEITWNGQEYVLAPGAATYQPMKPIATRKFATTVTPNPFNPTATIKFSLPHPSPVTVEVFNILGQKVQTLVKQGEYQAGEHTVTFDGRDESGKQLGSGVYLYQVIAGEVRRVGKMVLLK